jgi:hypothetical protein
MGHTYSLFGLLHLFPSAADSNCCLKLTRAADFWGAADVRAAFTAAKLAATHVQQQQQSHAAFNTKHAGDASCSVSIPQAGQHAGTPALVPGGLHAAAASAQVVGAGAGASHNFEFSSPGCSEAGAVVQAAPSVLAARAPALRAAAGIYDSPNVDDEASVGSCERQVRQQLIGIVCWASMSGDGSGTTRP